MLLSCWLAVGLVIVATKKELKVEDAHLDGAAAGEVATKKELKENSCHSHPRREPNRCN